jgi:predicted peptidase
MGQQALTFETQIMKTLHLDYLLFLPRDYDKSPQKRWPLILFLHGAGERGDPADSWWSSHIAALDALLNEVIATYSVDADRLYLTGLSVGGYGTWHLAAAYPRRFAALAPICGGGPWFLGFPERACVLKDVPIWVFHGAKDAVVPLEESEKMINVLTACGGNVRFTVYPDAEHDSWTETYDNQELYEWFLQHTLPQGGP